MFRGNRHQMNTFHSNLLLFIRQLSNQYIMLLSSFGLSIFQSVWNDSPYKTVIDVALNIVTSAQKILLAKSVVHYLCHLNSNNIIGQRKTTNKEKHFYPWLTSFNLKLSCKWEEKHMKIFFLWWDYVLNHHHAIGSDTTVVSVAVTFFNSSSYCNS